MLRRRFLQTAATLAAAPYARTSRAAGALTLACGSHQIQGANAVLSKLCNEWGEQEKVDVRIDFTDAFNLLMMGIAEASAKSGHDIIALPGWTAAAHAGQLGAGRRRSSPADRKVSERQA